MQTFKKPVLIIVLMLIAGGGILLTPGISKNAAKKTTSIKSPTEKPFPLADLSATYIIKKINENFMVTYQKDGPPITIYVGKSEIDLNSYVDKPVDIEGTFKTEEQTVQCIKAPCNPIETTVLDVLSITLAEK